ncbi:MAG TPA: ABC transporter ATP-binding protein [Patescibacteria group bacterium]|nr:ABC transporter ATP-binding protein [Patescibacteria group bacterium]
MSTREERAGRRADDGAVTLALEGLTVRYGSVAAVADVDLLVPDGRVTAIMGPSGCGKSTLLRAIAGLERPSVGRITYGGRDLARVPAHHRGFGLMFQDYVLFPHLDVAGNVAFGLRMQGLSPAAVRARVAEVLALVGLVGYGGRSVSQLSGGEQQRVGLARSLAPAPRLLMLDEPLGALDRALRERLLVELRELFDRLGIAIIYVTHDQEEAFAVADRVVVMRAGRVEQEGPAEEVWRQPATEFVARFLGFVNIGRATVEGAPGWAVAVTEWGRLPVAADAPRGDRQVVLRPGGFLPAPGRPIVRDAAAGGSGAADAPASDSAGGAGELGVIEGIVEARTFRGDHFLLRVRPASGGPLEIAAAWVPVPRTGDRVRLAVRPEHVIVL